MRKYELQVMTVTRVDQSPMNPQRWCLTLTCGHEVWITSRRRPKGMKAECQCCPAVALERHAAIQNSGGSR